MISSLSNDYHYYQGTPEFNWIPSPMSMALSEHPQSALAFIPAR
jgi:hypothetical protein